MEKVRKKNELDMTKGPMFGKLVAFAIPFALTNVLNLLFNSADMIVVGQFVGPDATGAVGSTGSLYNLILNLAMGFGVGTGVTLASAFGAKDGEYADQILHTSIFLAIIGSLVIGFTGFFLAPVLLKLMNTPSELIGMASAYMKIIFMGSLGNMLFCFGSFIMRAMGDTKRPLIFLASAGVLNVIINIVLVAGCHMGVEGVAIATIISQALSATLMVTALVRNKGFIRLSIKKIRPHKRALVDILKLGIPTGIQNSLFSISNVLLQTAVNSFGDKIINNGSAVSAQLEGYVYTILNAISSTTLTAVGQNYGAKDFKRIKKAIWQSTWLIIGVTLAVGWLVIACNKPLCALFVRSTGDAATDNLIVKYAFERMIILCGTYFLDGVMEVLIFAMRSMGNAFTSMMIVLIGTCFSRIFWIYCIFPLNRTLSFLFLMYPVSWTLTTIVAAVVLIVVYKKCKQRAEMQRDLAITDKISA